MPGTADNPLNDAKWTPRSRVPPDDDCADAACIAAGDRATNAALMMQASFFQPCVSFFMVVVPFVCTEYGSPTGRFPTTRAVYGEMPILYKVRMGLNATGL